MVRGFILHGDYITSVTVIMTLSLFIFLQEKFAAKVHNVFEYYGECMHTLTRTCLSSCG